MGLRWGMRSELSVKMKPMRWGMRYAMSSVSASGYALGYALRTVVRIRDFTCIPFEKVLHLVYVIAHIIYTPYSHSFPKLVSIHVLMY